MRSNDNRGGKRIGKKRGGERTEGKKIGRDKRVRGGNGSQNESQKERRK